jgi:hypothetical protein
VDSFTWLVVVEATAVVLPTIPTQCGTKAGQQFLLDAVEATTNRGELRALYMLWFSGNRIGRVSFDASHIRLANGIERCAPNPFSRGILQLLNHASIAPSPARWSRSPPAS